MYSSIKDPKTGMNINIHSKEGQKMFTNSGFAPMWRGLPAAVGACIANDKNRIVCLSGEGGLQMNIQELATIMQNKLPIKILIYKGEIFTKEFSQERNKA